MEQNSPFFQNTSPSELAPVMSVGKWIVTLLLLMIPVVNLVLLIVWAVGSSDQPNRKNFAIAALLMVVIVVTLWVIFASIIASSLGSFLEAFV